MKSVRYLWVHRMSGHVRGSWGPNGIDTKNKIIQQALYGLRLHGCRLESVLGEPKATLGWRIGW